MTSSRSKTASGVARQRAPAPRRRPRGRAGAPGGPRATRRWSRPARSCPARAPHSIDMLQTVMRPSIERARIADPAYSTTCPAAPETPRAPMVPRIRSLAPTPTPASPSMLTRIVRALACGSVWVARTCSTSLVPMPKASAPKAPCVEVWLSPQTIVMPGWVMPSSGPMMWTIPWRALRREKSGMSNSAQLRSRASTWAARERVGDARLAPDRRDVVVDRREGAVGPAHPAAGEPQAVEGLRRGHLVDQVEVHVEQGLLAAPLRDHLVGLPDLLEQRLAHLTHPPPRRARRARRGGLR